MCCKELNGRQQKLLKSILNPQNTDNGKTIIWDSGLKKYVFSTFEEVGNYVTTDTDQELYGTKVIYGYWAFQTDNWPTIAGQEIATVDYVQSAVSLAVLLTNVDQTIYGTKQFVKRPKVDRGGGVYEDVVTTSDLSAYATTGSLSALAATVANKANTSDLAAYALKSGNLSQFAATSSAQLASVISDETGSGALVFASSPTITTPILAGGSYQVNGATSGRIVFGVPSVAGNNILTFQAVTDTVAVLGTAQTFTASQISFGTLNANTQAARVVISTSGGIHPLRIENSSGYKIVGVNATNDYLTFGDSAGLIGFCNVNGANATTMGGSSLRMSHAQNGVAGYGLYLCNINSTATGTTNGNTWTANNGGDVKIIGMYKPSAAGSGSYQALNIEYTLNGTSGAQTGISTGLYLKSIETTLNGMTHNIIDCYAGAAGTTNIFRVTNAGVLTTASTIIAPASVAGAAGFRLSKGVTPTAPIDNDMWVAADDTVYIRLSGVNKRFTLA